MFASLLSRATEIFVDKPETCRNRIFFFFVYFVL